MKVTALFYGSYRKPYTKAYQSIICMVYSKGTWVYVRFSFRWWNNCIFLWFWHRSGKKSWKPIENIFEKHVHLHYAIFMDKMCSGSTKKSMKIQTFWKTMKNNVYFAKTVKVKIARERAVTYFATTPQTDKSCEFWYWKYNAK